MGDLGQGPPRLAQREESNCSGGDRAVDAARRPQRPPQAPRLRCLSCCFSYSVCVWGQEIRRVLQHLGFPLAADRGGGCAVVARQLLLPAGFGAGCAGGRVAHERSLTHQSMRFGSRWGSPSLILRPLVRLSPVTCVWQGFRRLWLECLLRGSKFHVTPIGDGVSIHRLRH